MRHSDLLANLVNGICALASGSNIFEGRKKENTLSGRLSDGRVSFEDALSHIYPETSKRAPSDERNEGVRVESVTIYESYKGLTQPFQSSQSSQSLPSSQSSQSLPSSQSSQSLQSSQPSQSSQPLQARSFENLPAALESLNQGQINLRDDLLDIPDEEFQSQIDTYDNLPVQKYQDLSAPTTDSQPVETYSPSAVNAYENSPSDTFENLTRVQAELAQQILVNYAESVSPVRKDFLENLTSASAEFLATRNKPAEPVFVPNSMSTSMSALVDRIFNTLEPYIHELNQTFRATDLSITFTPPSVVNENFACDTSRRPSIVVSSYRCRISTSCLALVIRGKEDRIDFFLLPVERVIGLSKTEDQHDPLMTFTANAQNGTIYWEVEQKPLTEERLERYILLVFEHLMDLTREELLRRPALVGAF